MCVHSSLSKGGSDSGGIETPIAYLWARTIISEAPDDGSGIPVEVPLMRSLWLAKKKGRNRALRWLRDGSGLVKTETVEITYTDGVTRTVRRPLLEIFEPKSAKEVEDGTVKRGSGTCPVTGFTTPVASVQKQIKERNGGAADARLYCVVTTSSQQKGRLYRLPNVQDILALEKSYKYFNEFKNNNNLELSLIPNEKLDVRGIRHTWAMVYGVENWGDCFNQRQSISLVCLIKMLKKSDSFFSNPTHKNLSLATYTCISLVIDKVIQYNSSLCRWKSSGENLVDTFGRQALPMVWDFAEANIVGGSSGDFNSLLEWFIKVIETVNISILSGTATVEQSLAQEQILPNEVANAVITDPPYYDAIPYAYLSDYFYTWLRRSLKDKYPKIFSELLVPKDLEIVVDRPHKLSKSTKNIKFYEQELTKAFSDSFRVLNRNGICVIVFASWTVRSSRKINEFTRVSAPNVLHPSSRLTIAERLSMQGF